MNYTADQNGFRIVKGDGSSRGGSGSGGQAAGDSDAGGGNDGGDNADNNAADDNDTNAGAETIGVGDGEPGPFGADHGANALDNAK